MAYHLTELLGPISLPFYQYLWRVYWRDIANRLYGPPFTM